MIVLCTTLTPGVEADDTMYVDGAKKPTGWFFFQDKLELDDVIINAG